MMEMGMQGNKILALRYGVTSLNKLQPYFEVACLNKLQPYYEVAYLNKLQPYYEVPGPVMV